MVARSFLCALAAGAVAAAALAAFAACDQGGSLVPTGDAGPGDAADATTGDGEANGDASDAGTVEELHAADVCGDAPWVTLGIVVTQLNIANLDASTPLPGASFTTPLCPGLVKTSDEAGVIEGLISQDVPFYGRLQAPGYVSELAPEEIFDADSTGNKVEMLSSFLAGVLFPGLDGGSTVIVIAAQKLQDDAGACSSLDGISFNVPGHPEATVYYLSSDSIPMLTDASATSSRGLAAITGLAGGQLVNLGASKPGCTVLFVHGPLTGRVPLENGFASLMPAYLSP
ncbi:MAG TPA: hypothetical protein VF765_16760 [Polyangiaceae bacterium]